MASQNPNTDWDSNSFLIPTLALKQALCFACWDTSSNLRRCNACKRVSYCSVKCQKQDWNRNHKNICKNLVAFNKQIGYVPSAGRKWNNYDDEQVRYIAKCGIMNRSEFGTLVLYEPYCYHCYRRRLQLEDGAKLNTCPYCLLTSFCTSCEQTHPSAECATLQDIAADDKILVKLHRQTGKTSTGSMTSFPRKQYCPLSSATDWYDYYTRLSDKGGWGSKMNRDLKYQADDPREQELVEILRYGTNTTTLQLTLIAALEATIPDIGTRRSIRLHIIGAAAEEFNSIPGFEELLHLLPSLKVLELSFVGPNAKTHTLECCSTCTKMGRSISISGWRGPYHAYIDSDSYETPDLAAAFHSGFSVDEEASWWPTIKYLAHAPHPTLFTAARNFEVRGEMEVWKKLGAGFVKDAEVNKWKGMSPSFVAVGDTPNEVMYQNHWWYIVKPR